MAAAVVAAQGTYIMDRVAVHLGQQQARSGRRRRQRARVLRTTGRRQQQKKAHAEQAVAREALAQVEQADEQSSVMSQSSDTQQMRGGTDGEGTSSIQMV